MAHAEILKPRTLHTTSLKTSIAQLIVFSIRLHPQNHSVVNRN